MDKLLDCVERALELCGEAPDGVAERLAEIRDLLIGGERMHGRRADGTYFRADAGMVQDDGTVVLCTQGEARDGHILDIGTLRVDAYKQNPVLFYNHNGWSDDPPIGRVIPDSIATSTVDTGVAALSGRIEFHRKSEKSIEVADVWDAGFLRCMSATWRPSDRMEDTIRRSQLPIDHPAYKADGYGYYFKNAELVENSVVGIPSDPRAKRVRDGVSIDAALIEQIADQVARRLTLKPTAGWWDALKA